MLAEDEHIKCNWCNSVSTAKNWNDETFNCCNNREMKRKFLSIFNEKAFSKNGQKYYKCPVCKNWSKGSQLSIVDTDNRYLLSLGGEPVIKHTKIKN